MNLLIKFWPHALAVVAIAAAVGWFSNTRYQAGYAASSAHWKARLATAAENGKKDVDRAFDEARKEQERYRTQQQQREQSARELHQQALNTAQVEARIWHDRYRKALSNDSSCAAWSQASVPCPL